MPGIGRGISPLLKKASGGVSLPPFTSAFVITVVGRGGVVTDAEKEYLSVFETSMGSNLAELDRFWIHGLSNNVAARTSFVNPTSTIITAVNNPTFIPNQGYQGNGSTSYLNTNYNPSTQGVKYTLNNASGFAYIGNNIVSQTVAFGSLGSGAVSAFLYPQYNSLTPLYAINDGGQDNTGTGNSLGLSSVLRINNTSSRLFKNGVLNGSATRSSVTIPNLPLFIGGFNLNGNLAGGSTYKFAATGFGSSAVNQTTLNNSIQTLGTSLGWAVIQNNVSAYGGVNGNTTTATNTTNAKLFVATVQSYKPVGTPTITDSAGNTWTLISRISGASAPSVSAYYCINPTTSASHTFTVSLANGYASISVNVFSGPNFTYNSFNSNTGGSVTSIGAGLITPTSTRNLIVTSVNYWIGDAPNSITDSFIITNNIPATGTTLSGSTAYKLNSAAVNPTWSWTNASGEVATIIACFTY